VRRIAVVRNDRLGDLVVTTPAIAALRAAYPDAKLTLVVRPLTAPLARSIDGVDEVIEDPGSLAGLADVLRNAKTDLMVSIAIGARNALAGVTARIPERVGPGHRPYSPLFTRTVNEHRHDGERHEVEYALSYAHCAGAAGGPASFPIRVPPEDDARARGWLLENEIHPPFVVLHPGSGGSCPAWPVESFLELANRLIEERRSVVLSIGPADVTALMHVAEHSPRIRSIPRFTSDLPDLAALLRLASLVVSNSTGPLHLAAALGAPTLALHAPWPTCGVSRWGPYAGNGWALTADGENATSWSRAQRLRRGAELMATLPTEAVLDAIHRILEEGPR
jgi:ADP-heptose:LPS heptosyltransferase